MFSSNLLSKLRYGKSAVLLAAARLILKWRNILICENSERQNYPRRKIKSKQKIRVKNIPSRGWSPSWKSASEGTEPCWRQSCGDRNWADRGSGGSKWFRRGRRRRDGSNHRKWGWSTSKYLRQIDRRTHKNDFLFGFWYQKINLERIEIEIFNFQAQNKNWENVVENDFQIFKIKRKQIS